MRDAMFWIAGFFFGLHLAWAIAAHSTGRTNAGWFAAMAALWLLISGAWFIARKPRVVATALLLLPLSAQAGTMPLATFSWSQPQPVSLPAIYIAALTAYDGIYSTADWRETVAAYPHHSFANLATVDAYNRVLYSAENGELRFFHGGQVYNNGLCDWCQLYWSIGDGMDEYLAEKAAAGFEAELFVPRRGPHLIGYSITGIERTVTADSQTITFHGVPIPEPASWLLVLCCGLIHWRLRWAVHCY